MSASKESLLVASQSGRTLDFFDIDTLSKIETISDLTAQPHEIAWDPNRRVAYIAHTYRTGGYGEPYEKAHEISVIDVDRHAVLDVIDIAPFFAPHDIEFDPVHDVIVTGVELVDGRNGLVIVNPTTKAVVESIELKAPNAHWLSLTPDGAKAYVTHKDAEVISVVDLIGRRQLLEIPAPAGAEEVDCSPDGRFAYVSVPMMSLFINASQGSLTKKPREGAPQPSVIQIDVSSDEIVGRCEFNDCTSAIRVAPDGRILASEFRFRLPDSEEPARGVVHVINPKTMDVEATITCGELPFTIRCSTDGTLGFVANLKSGTVTVIDLADYSVRGELDNNPGLIWGGTHGMCTVPPGAPADAAPAGATAR